MLSSVQFSRSIATPCTAARQASLSITNCQSLPKLMSIELVMPSNHLILCHPLLLLPSIFFSIRVFSNELALHIRWPEYWSFSFNISPSSEHPGLISFRMDCWISKVQVSFNFKAAVTICSDFGAQENKVWHCFHCFPIYLPWSDGTRCHDLSFLNVEF